MDTHCKRMPVTATRRCLVPVLSRSAKTSFPGRGPLRCAPWSFPPGGGKVPRPVAPASTVPVPWRGAAQDLGVRDPTAATLPASTRKQDRRPDGNKSNGSPRTSPKKQNTERVCEDPLPPLPLSLCASFLSARGQRPPPPCHSRSPGCKYVQSISSQNLATGSNPPAGKN